MGKDRLHSVDEVLAREKPGFVRVPPAVDRNDVDHDAMYTRRAEAGTPDLPALQRQASRRDREPLLGKANAGTTAGAGVPDVRSPEADLARGRDPGTPRDAADEGGVEIVHIRPSGAQDRPGPTLRSRAVVIDRRSGTIIGESG